jgi:Transglycosylase SLT domain
MMRCFLAVLLVSGLSTLAMAEPATPPTGGAELLCRPAILAAERAHAVPRGLMTAIGRVESGRRDPMSGISNPWPWTVNAEGQGYFFDTKAQALAAVRAMQARGVRSIDVGCMQVNLMHHPDAFASLDLAFDPTVNADYAARFLTELFSQTSAWPLAVGRYHSATPDLGEEYKRKVMAIWPEEQVAPVAVGSSALQRAWAATVSQPPPAFRRGEGWHIIPKTALPGQPVAPGRGLDSYRAMPVLAATRVPIRTGG